jgi:thiol-disulfide isomerase/thioredoxin
MNKNRINLAAVIIVIALVIGYLEYNKNAGRVNVPAGSADIPLTLGTASTTDLTAGQCTTEYCTTTTSTAPATVLNATNAKPNAVSINTTIGDKLKKYPRAKELVAPSGFINSPNGDSTPFKVADLIGKKVILVDFWTYSCINCQRTLPYMNAWYEKYKDAGLEIIGVETPEFDFEKSKANVEAAVKKYGIKYPVVQDNERGTWSAYANMYWPRKYLVDIDGFIVYDHIGEGGYADTEKEIQKLLQEKAVRDGKQLDFSGTVATEVAKTATVGMFGVSPETYFGSFRNDSYVGNVDAGTTGVKTYALDDSGIRSNKFYLDKKWNIGQEYIENIGEASLTYKYTAMNVYLVASTADGKPINVDIYQDGTKIKTITIQGAQLYQLIKNSGVETHTLKIVIPTSGLQAYTFTFG